MSFNEIIKTETITRNHGYKILRNYFDINLLREKGLVIDLPVFSKEQSRSKEWEQLIGNGMTLEQLAAHENIGRKRLRELLRKYFTIEWLQENGIRCHHYNRAVVVEYKETNGTSTRQFNSAVDAARWLMRKGKGSDNLRYTRNNIAEAAKAGGGYYEGFLWRYVD